MPSAGQGSLHQSFRPDLDAAPAARQALEDLRNQIDDDLLERCRLAVTEIVTNCVKHAQLRSAELIEVEIWALPEMVRIEITDPGPGFDPVDARYTDNGSGGWGLLLVDQLTDRWGVDLSHSTRVWLEFDRHSS